MYRFQAQPNSEVSVYGDSDQDVEIGLLVAGTSREESKDHRA